MDPARTSAPKERPWLPRTRGDGPPQAISARRRSEAASQTRGWTLAAKIDAGDLSGCPARAGMDPDTGRKSRTRGRLAPHARGLTLHQGSDLQHLHGCPAPAGMDLASARTSVSAPGLPRTRGDGPTESHGTPCSSAAAPHARGWTLCYGEADGFNTGCPARAGMDPRRGTPATSTRWLPRTRGDGPQYATQDFFSDMAAAHARGWTWPLQLDDDQRRGCPARAGVNPGRPRPGRGSTRLPRTRGDGPIPCAIRVAWIKYLNFGQGL